MKSQGIVSPVQRDRRTFLGASECAAILGRSRWSTPLYIWAIKTGQIEPGPETLPQKLGKRLEPIVAELFEEETGKKLVDLKQTLFHPQHDIIGATVDRMVYGEKAGMELKTCTPWKSKEWEGDEIPDEYILQCYHSLAVTGMDRWYIAVLIGNQDFKWKVIEKDERLQADIIKRELQFWNDFVVPNVMPTTITKRDRNTLDELFPQAEEECEVVLPDEANILVENIEAYEADLKNVEGLAEQAKNQLKALLKTAERGSTSLYKVFWKNMKTRRIDVERLKAAAPALYKQYLKETLSRRFDYTKVKQEE